MTGTGDQNFGLVIAALNRASLMNDKQLWMQRSSIQTEDQLGNFWANG
jgi:hypothetical protein